MTPVMKDSDIFERFSILRMYGVHNKRGKPAADDGAGFSLFYDYFFFLFVFIVFAI